MCAWNMHVSEMIMMSGPITHEKGYSEKCTNEHLLGWAPFKQIISRAKPIYVRKPCHKQSIFFWKSSDTMHNKVFPLWQKKITKLLLKLQSSAALTRSNIARYYKNSCRNCGRISIRCWIHKRHPTSHPNRWAMGCLLWMFMRKLTAL